MIEMNNTQQQHAAPVMGNQNIPSGGAIVQQQQTPNGVHMNGADFKQQSNRSLPLVKPTAFLQYQASSHIPEKATSTQPHYQQSQPQQQNITTDAQAAASPGQAYTTSQEWSLNLISAAFKGFGHIIVLDNAQFVQAATHLSETADLQNNHPAFDQTLSWHRLAAPPIVPRYITNDLTIEQQATEVVAKIVGAGLLTRLALDQAFVIAAFEYLLSLTVPVSMVTTKPVLVKCHHCGAPTATRVEHVRGAATWGCMYLMCFLWLPCLSVMFWNNETWMNKRHYCSVCGGLLALWEKAKTNREKGTKVYTQWGNFRLQPGEELASRIGEV